MKYYIQYFQNNDTEALGSEGYSPLDGRLSKENMMLECYNPKRNFGQYKLCELRKGNFRNYTVIFRTVLFENL